jgi:hypothetical protein
MASAVATTATSLMPIEADQYRARRRKAVRPQFGNISLSLYATSVLFVAFSFFMMLRM